MTIRATIFCVMCALHLLAIFQDLEIFSPLAAGSIYLPLMGLKAIGVPVFMNGGSGGWAAPSAMGWAFALIVWSAVWWFLSGMVYRSWNRKYANK